MNKKKNKRNKKHIPKSKVGTLHGRGEFSQAESLVTLAIKTFEDAENAADRRWVDHSNFAWGVLTGMAIEFMLKYYIKLGDQKITLKELKNIGHNIPELVEKLEDSNKVIFDQLSVYVASKQKGLGLKGKSLLDLAKECNTFDISIRYFGAGTKITINTPVLTLFLMFFENRKPIRVMVNGGYSAKSDVAKLAYFRAKED